MTRNTGIAFHYLDKDMVKKVIKAVIRPKMEDAQTVWFSHKKKHVSKPERIQRTAVKMVLQLEELSCEEKLKEMNLQTLEQRERRDLILLYKLWNKMEEVDNEELY